METTLHGPGALACWYLTFLRILITWKFHPSNNLHQLKITLDVILFALYACLAAGRTAMQITRFGRNSGVISTRSMAWGEGWEIFSGAETVDELSPERKEAAKGCCLPISRLR